MNLKDIHRPLLRSRGPGAQKKSMVGLLRGRVKDGGNARFIEVWEVVKPSHTICPFLSESAHSNMRRKKAMPKSH